MPAYNWTPYLPLLPFALALYLLPTIVALLRRLPRLGLLFALNLFCGWTAITWLICILWACFAPRWADPTAPWLLRREFHSMPPRLLRSGRGPVPPPRIARARRMPTPPPRP
jgi:hypothetical protein